MSASAIDKYFMRMAISAAMRGTGKVSPNPLVGAVLVKDEEVLSVGFHKAYGMPHAEVDAIKNCRTTQGATIYVNLEPCCHHGKTPPCTTAIVRAGIKRVVYGTADPNPLVSSNGLKYLAENGIEVAGPLLQKEAKYINKGFIRRMTMNRPWITLKAAASSDGTTALSNGQSKWITSPQARERSQLLRAENDGVMVGVGTVLADNPSLTVREVEGNSPKRIILDRYLRSPLSSNIFKDKNAVMFCGYDVNPARLKEFSDNNIAVYHVQASKDGLCLESLLKILAQNESINNLLIEGGPTIWGAFLRLGLVDAVSIFIAPRILGKGIQLGEKFALFDINMGIDLKSHTLRKVGPDYWLEGIASCSPDL